MGRQRGFFFFERKIIQKKRSGFEGVGENYFVTYQGVKNWKGRQAVKFPSSLRWKDVMEVGFDNGELYGLLAT